MTYNENLEKSEQEPMPEFFELVSAGQTDRYTSFNRTLQFLGQTWTAAPITRTGLSKDTRFGAVRVNISAPLSGQLPNYIANQPIEPVRVTIYSAIKSDLSDYIIKFKGSLMRVGIKDMEVRATCEARSTLFTSRIPNIIFQSYCNNDIFDKKCKASEFDFRIKAEVTNISGSDYTITGLDAEADGFYSGGVMQFGADYRLITDHVGNVVTLHIPFDARVYVGVDAIILPGCDGSPQLCVSRYDNILNFVGMPYIPSHNPVVWGFK